MPGSLSPRPVNSNVIAPRTNGKTCSLNHGLNGFAFSARLGADETCVVGRRYNKSLDRSANQRASHQQLAPNEVACAPGQFQRYVCDKIVLCNGRNSNRESNLLSLWRYAIGSISI